MTCVILHPWLRRVLVCFFLIMIIAELAMVQYIEISIAQSIDPIKASKELDYHHVDPYYGSRYSS